MSDANSILDDDYNDPLDPKTEEQIDKEYECICFGRHMINTSPKVILSFLVSVILIIAVIVLILTVGQVSVFAPILAAVVAFWLPSPLQSSMSRKDAVNEARLRNTNRKMKRTLNRYGRRFGQMSSNIQPQNSDIEHGSGNMET
jgi:hypothetical protein